MRIIWAIVFSVFLSGSACAANLVCGGVDDTAAIQAAIDATPKGEVRLPVGTCVIKDTIYVRTPTAIVGQGRGGRYSNGISGDATRIEWGSGSDKTMIEFAPEDVGTNNQIVGARLEGVAIDGKAKAGTCLSLKAVTFSRFDVSVQDCKDYGVYLGYTTQTSGYRGVMRSYFDINGSFSAGSDNGVGLYLDGTDTQGPGTNANFNYFQAVRLRYKNEDAIVIKNGDNNTFMMTDMIYAGGSGKGVRLKAAQWRPARATTFFSLSPGAGGVVAEGTETASTPSYGNTIFIYDKDNPNPDPVIETGATLFWRHTNQEPFP